MAFESESCFELCDTLVNCPGGCLSISNADGIKPEMLCAYEFIVREAVMPDIARGNKGRVT